MKALISLAVFGASVLLLLSFSSILANPIPSSAIYTHVQLQDEGAPPLATCAEIVQHTAAQGALQFDLYLIRFFADPPFGVGTCHIEFEWEENWIFTGYDVPGITTYPYLGYADVQIIGNRAVVDIEWGWDWWEDCPVTDDELFLLMRCYVTVDGYGQFQHYGWDNEVALCNPEGEWHDPQLIWAKAGISCAFCDTPCGLGDHCWPTTDTPVLDLQVNMGETANVEIPYELLSGYGYACSGECGGTEDWMTVSGETPDGHEYTLTLDVDTAGLPLGSYSSWVHVDSGGCRACTLVNLEVLDLTGVESGFSWSYIKAFY